MDFHLIDNRSSIFDPSSEDGFYLIHTNWDDWFQFETSYSLWAKIKGEVTNVGTTKIGSTAMTGKTASLPAKFKKLDDSFFSLGSSESFYIELNNDLLQEFRERILMSLNDVAFNEKYYAKAKIEKVYSISLSRGIPEDLVTGRYRRLAQGELELSTYHFRYYKNSEDKDNYMEFQVNPDKNFPTNIHAIIGRNGVGKSYLLNNMLDSLLNKKDNFQFSSKIDEGKFSNIVSVNFSSFERKEVFPNNNDTDKGYLYYNLSAESKAKRPNSFYDPKISNLVLTGGSVEVTDEENVFNAIGMEGLFIESLIHCFYLKPKLWKSCIEILNSDPIFNALEITDLYSAYCREEEHFNRIAFNLFNKLSSGHKIVLLTLTKLVELSSEKTLVIMDEPEMHLHPPLIASYIRSLSHLLTKVNGVGILATHSPIILQETQKSCSYKLDRTGADQTATRPKIETFGEDVGVLTNDVFGLEVTQSGFYQLINEAVNLGKSFNETMDLFENKMGSEAYTMLLTLINLRDRNNE